MLDWNYSSKSWPATCFKHMVIVSTVLLIQLDNVSDIRI